MQNTKTGQLKALFMFRARPPAAGEASYRETTARLAILWRKPPAQCLFV